jgi:hypothetical protein
MLGIEGERVEHSMLMNIVGTKNGGCMSHRGAVRAGETSLSRRDFAKVAWHEVPGKTPKQRPSRRDGMIAAFTRESWRKTNPCGKKQVPATSSHRPYGTDLFGNTHQAINCPILPSVPSRQPTDRPELQYSITPRAGFEHEHEILNSLCVKTA